jgi:hypothetical protein
MKIQLWTPRHTRCARKDSPAAEIPNLYVCMSPSETAKDMTWYFTGTRPALNNSIPTRIAEMAGGGFVSPPYRVISTRRSRMPRIGICSSASAFVAVLAVLRVSRAIQAVTPAKTKVATAKAAVASAMIDSGVTARFNHGAR